MKWCVDFPEETVLVVRPSLRRICFGFKPAGKLLSTLLYRVSIRKEAKEDAENLNGVKSAQGQEADQDTSLRVYRTQAQLVADMADEMNEKTLHDVAVPTLQLLGYLDIEEYPGCNCYILHLDAVQQALTTLKEQKVKLEKFLIGRLQAQLEKFLIDPELEKFLIDKKKFVLNKKYFLLQLEKVLIANRELSHCKRGRKPAPKVPAEGQNEVPQNLKDNKEILENNKENIGAIAPTPSDVSLSSENSLQTTSAEYEAALSYLKACGYEHIIVTNPAEMIRLASELRKKTEQPHSDQSENDFQPEQQTLMTPTQQQSAKQAPKWNEKAMVALTERLRGRLYTDKQRPKELAAAEKLLKQKPDCTPEEYEQVYQKRNDDWWRENCGLLNVTDLAAVPKNKNDLRYMLVLDQIHREAERKKAPPAPTAQSQPPAPRPLQVSSSVADMQAIRARKMAERAAAQAQAQAQGGH